MTTDTTTFPAGTIAKCNRCSAANPLPKDCTGHLSGTHKGQNAEGITHHAVYRLETMCTLACGHMDAHWVYTTVERIP